MNAKLLACPTAQQVEGLIFQTKSPNDFDAINCSTAFRCLAKHRSRSTAAVDKLLTLCNQQPAFSGQALSSICHSIASGKLGKRMPREIVQRLEGFDFNQFDAQAIGNCLWAFAKLDPQSADSFIIHSFCSAIAHRNAMQGLGEFQPQNFANIVWALATLRFLPQSELGVFPAIAREVTVRQSRNTLRDFYPQDVSNMLWAYATMNDDSLCKAFELELTSKHRDLTIFSQQSISNILWAYSTLGYASTALFTRIGRDVSLARYSPQHLATVAWASSQQRQMNSDAVMEKVWNEFIAQSTSIGLTLYSAQDLCNLLWSFSNLRNGDDDVRWFDAARLCNLVLSELLKRNLGAQARDGLNSKDVCNVMQALIHFHHQGALPFNQQQRGFFLRVADEGNLPAHSLLALVQMLRALATFNLKDQRHTAAAVCEEILRQARRAPRALSPHSISTVFWSCAALEFNHFDLCGALLGQTPPATHEYSVQDLSTLVWALATLDQGQETGIINALAAELCTRARVDFSMQDLISAIWGFACLDALGEVQVRNFFQTTSVAPPALHHRAFPAALKDAQQLLHASLAWKQTNPGVRSTLLDWLCHGDWIETTLGEDDMGRKHKLSQAHQAIARVLKRSFPGDFEVESTVEEGISVDMLIPSKRIVVEVDGPTHFFPQTGTRTGKTKFMRRLLERAGYRVFSIPVSKFYAMDDDQDAVLQSLVNVIKDCR